MFKKLTIGIIVLVVSLITYNVINQITQALSVSDRLSKVADDVYRAEIKNKELKKKLSEIKSVRFVEEEARNKLGLAKPGETIVVIPDEKIKEILGATEAAQAQRLPNWQGWLRVFFR